MHGGDWVAKALVEEQVRFLFTLCGGHISPILVSAKASGIRVIDTRHEANAVFAADAVARMTGIPGVAAVTAGPGITNTITAVRNSLLAQTPLVLLGGAAPTLLKGRGALQDIDQMKLIKSNVKWATAVRRVGDIYPAVRRAFSVARDGVPGPVFVELPLDLLYPEAIVKEGFEKTTRNATTISQRITAWYIKRHLRRVFAEARHGSLNFRSTIPSHRPADLNKVRQLIRSSVKPVMLIGSGAMMIPELAGRLDNAINSLSIPVYLSGMARGLLGPTCPYQFRHNRKEALREADLIILAGVPCDFRLEYGQQLNRQAKVISVNRSSEDLFKNRRPSLAILADPMNFLISLGNSAREIQNELWEDWKKVLMDREQKRNNTINEQGSDSTGIHPVALFRKLDTILSENSVIVADGGDFVGTASYIVRPRRALSWLDPGVFGTLGIGGGFATAAKLCRPDSEVIILYGDGSAAYSLAEFDTFVRHRLPVIAIVGNDASWSQIARDQVEILKDDVGTVLSSSNYQQIAEAFGGSGRRVETMEEFLMAFSHAQESVRKGNPYLINVVLAPSDFRKGSISM